MRAVYFGGRTQLLLVYELNNIVGFFRMYEQAGMQTPRECIRSLIEQAGMQTPRECIDSLIAGRRFKFLVHILYNSCSCITEQRVVAVTIFGNGAEGHPRTKGELVTLYISERYL